MAMVVGGCVTDGIGGLDMVVVRNHLDQKLKLFGRKPQ